MHDKELYKLKNIWHIGDTHFYHKNVILYGDRPFDNIHKMNKYMINKWNSKIKKYDKVYFQGDFSFGTKEETEYILSQLNGNKILIKGNHDTRSNDWWLQIGFTEVSKYPIIINDLILSHQPIPTDQTIGSMFNIHAHVHQKVQEHEALSPDKYKCVSVEMIDYTPISTYDLLKSVGRI